MNVWIHQSNVGTLVLSGPGALERLLDELRGRGLGRAFVISSPSAFVGAGMQAVRTTLGGIELTGAFADVRPHAPEHDIRAAARALSESGADFILSVGGASVGDTAKGAALLHSGSDLVLDLSGLRPGASPRAGLLPIVNVPLTLAGAEFLAGGAYNRDGHKDGFVAPGLAHAITVYDPRCLADVPASVLCSSGFNGLAHALESSLTDRATPYSRALAAASAMRFARYLPARAAGETTDEVLTGLGEAAVLGSLAYVIGMAGVHHAICHALGGVYGVPHALANAAILPYALAANESESEEVQSELAGVIGRELTRFDVAAVPSLAECIQSLQELVGLDGLEGYSLAGEDLDIVAREVMRETVGGSTLSPRRLDESQVRGILQAAVQRDLDLARV